MHGRTHASASPPSSLSASAANISSFPGLSRDGGAHRRSTPSLSPRPQNHSRPPQTRAHWHDPGDERTLSLERSLAMSPLALALQAQWRQLQQEMLSPSSLRSEQSDSHTAEMEEDVLRVLGMIAAQPDMAVKDAAHTVPYLVALGQMPLPSLRTQVVALSALRGVLSSLTCVFGNETAEAFVCDVFLGEHQALQALIWAALIAMEEFHDATGIHHSGSTKADIRSSPPSALGSSFAAPLARSSHRSLLSRSYRDAPKADEAMRESRVFLKDLGEETPLPHPNVSSRVDKGSFEPLDEKTALRGRVTHVALQLLRDAAILCGPIADAMLSSGALFKMCMYSLHSLPPPPPAMNPGGPTVKPSRGGSENLYLAGLRRCEDIVSLFLTLLNAESTRRNEASLVLCSFHAPRGVCALAQCLVRTPLFAPGAVLEEASTLLWNALKVLARLTRSCPTAVRLLLSENTGVPAFLVQVLRVPVAEIREAGALWAAALLETQPEASAELVSSLFDATLPPAKTMMPPSSTPLPVFVASLIEMLRWRGTEMHVFRVSAILCWRLLLLSDPSRVAALLSLDSSVLATLIELIMRGATCSPSSSADALPLRLTALEALHVLALSYALGSIETRANLESKVLWGQLSSTTLRRLRTDAHSLLEQTHPAYWNAFPAMEVDSREGATELSDEVRLAASGSDRGRRLAMRISTGAAWRQVVLESLWELTGAAAATDAASAHTRVGDGHVVTQQSQRPKGFSTAALRPGAGMSASDVFGSSPIRVLNPASLSRASAGKVGPAGGDISKDQERDSSTASLLDSTENPTFTHAPRTIREATLLPTQQSTTAFRFHVVQQADSLGGSFVQDSMQVVLRLAQHYTQATTPSSTSSSKIPSSSFFAAGEGQCRGPLQYRSPLRGSSRSRSASPSLPTVPGAPALTTSPSAVFGTAPRFVDTNTRIEKERNPFAPVTRSAERWQAQPPRRQWRVEEMQRDDVLLFLVYYANLMTDLPEAIAAVEDHLYYLRRQLQLCPTREIRRRCVLNDLYMNVYPKLHLFLRYIDQQARRSRSVLQLLSTFSGGTIHSGNVVDVYDAVGHCTGLSTAD